MKRVRMTEGGEGEIQRLMGKKTAPQPQWGLLPRTPEYLYPSVIKLKEGGLEEVIEQYGSSLEGSVSRWREEGDAGWWEFVHEQSEVRIRLRHGTDGEELSFSPLTEIAMFAASSAAYVAAIVVDTVAMP